jgi:hypothetical protein
MVVDKYGNLWPTAFVLCSECKQPDNCGDCEHGELLPEHVREIGGVPGYGELTAGDAIRIVQEICADYFAADPHRRNPRIWEAIEFVCNVTEEHGEQDTES